MVTPTGIEATKSHFYKVASGKITRKILIKYELPKNAIDFDTVATVKAGQSTDHKATFTAWL